jgi:hypothetical protein
MQKTAALSGRRLLIRLEHVINHGDEDSDLKALKGF